MGIKSLSLQFFRFLEKIWFGLELSESERKLLLEERRNVDESQRKKLLVIDSKRSREKKRVEDNKRLTEAKDYRQEKEGLFR